LPQQDADVQIDFIQRDDGSWFLRVTDKGIGMTADTIWNYFLRAGASFRQSPDWAKEFLDEQGKPRVVRAGRFGIGAFAVFLLGPRFRLWTRHVSTGKDEGYSLEASADSQLIEIRRVDGLPVGTTIEVDISSESADILGIDEEKQYYDKFIVFNIKTDWFCWGWPVVIRRVIRVAGMEVLTQKYVESLCKAIPTPEWSAIHPPGFDVVYWTFADYPRLICNGLRISSPDGHGHDYGYTDDFDWPEETCLFRPKIAVLDSGANLPLTTQRYDLSDENLPFIAELSHDIALSFIAHALICSPTSRTKAHVLGEQPKPHPLVTYTARSKDRFGNGLLRWCSSSRAIIPADPWLYSLLQTEACLIFGGIGLGYYPKNGSWEDIFSNLQMQDNTAISFWSGCIDEEEISSEQFGEIFCELVINGFKILGSHVLSVHMLVSELFGLGAIDTIREGFSAINHQGLTWQNITPPTSKRKYFTLQSEDAMNSLLLERTIEAVEADNVLPGSFKDFLFVAQVKTKVGNPQPETLLAKTWNECLGPSPIPFDPEARRALIERGRQHPELKRHIEAWEEMKRTGSKWVYGDVGD
jgi:hypothetical protein